jgi:hypothetical protein
MKGLWESIHAVSSIPFCCLQAMATPRSAPAMRRLDVNSVVLECTLHALQSSYNVPGPNWVHTERLTAQGLCCSVCEAARPPRPQVHGSSQPSPPVGRRLACLYRTVGTLFMCCSSRDALMQVAPASCRACKRRQAAGLPACISRRRSHQGRTRVTRGLAPWSSWLHPAGLPASAVAGTAACCPLLLQARCLLYPLTPSCRRRRRSCSMAPCWPLRPAITEDAAATMLLQVVPHTVRTAYATKTDID